MTHEKFIEKAKSLVRDYTYDHIDKSDVMPEVTPYVVWACKTLQNSKAMLSTNILDGMYYEVTYNGDKHEIYLDAYKKFENRCIKVEDEKVVTKDQEAKEWGNL